MCGSIYIVYHHKVQVARAQDWCLHQWAEEKTPPAQVATGVTTTCASRGGVCVCVCVCLCGVVWCGVVWCGTCGWGWGCECGKETAEKRENRKDQLESV